MRKIFFSLAFVLSMVFLSYSASAQVAFSSQPNSIYNVGDVINASNITISPDLIGGISVYLVCNTTSHLIGPTYPSGIPYIPSFVLTESNIGGSSAVCSIQAYLNNTWEGGTNPFQVSNSVNVVVSSGSREFKPGDQISFQGNAIKQDGQNLDGIVGLSVINEEGVSIYQVSSVLTNGSFLFNFSLPSGTAAGQYLVSLNAYEMDSSGVEINTGSTGFNMLIDQVPTSLNLVPQNSAQSIAPGQGYSLEAILYDQTGQEINSLVNFTINKSDGIMSQQANTDQFINIPVSYDDPPNTWAVIANSEGLSAQLSFQVLENKNVTIDLLGRTVLVTNVGNVPYNDPISVNLGNQSLVFNVSLGVGQSHKYVLSAPDGNYSIEISSLGSDLYNGNLLLTGNAIGVQQAPMGASFIQYPLVWIVLLIILAVLVFFLIKRLSKKKFMKKVDLNKSFRLRDGIVISNGKDEISSRGRFVNSRNVAELSLSLQGTKHGSTIVCLGIRNFSEIRSGKGGISETMNRIKSIADEFNAAVYENGSNIFLIFSPLRTKSQNNDFAAIQSAEQVQKVLQDHNRLLKQKIDFGISVHYGMIVAKLGVSGMKFMTLGNVISTAKKLAAVSNGEVFLSKEVRDRIATDVKTEMHSSGDLSYYTLLEIRNREKNQKFIKDFMNKMEREEKEKRS